MSREWMCSLWLFGLFAVLAWWRLMDYLEDKEFSFHWGVADEPNDEPTTPLPDFPTEGVK
ncbi:MAG: hypothetical protein M0R37_10445 [Bacteroidales bacterium]|nr:hypothetical protein [Bacteroidales bacterium]